MFPDPEVEPRATISAASPALTHNDHVPPQAFLGKVITKDANALLRPHSNSAFDNTPMMRNTCATYWSPPRPLSGFSIGSRI